jgi:hypothetical protein
LDGKRPETYPEKADVEPMIGEFGGDARAALRARAPRPCGARGRLRELCVEASCGADLPCKNAIRMQAAQAADGSRKKLDDPSLTRPLPFPGIMPTNSRLVPFRPCHDYGITLPGERPRRCLRFPKPLLPSLLSSSMPRALSFQVEAQRSALSSGSCGKAIAEPGDADLPCSARDASLWQLASLL